MTFAGEEKGVSTREAGLERHVIDRWGGGGRRINDLIIQSAGTSRLDRFACNHINGTGALTFSSRHFRARPRTAQNTLISHSLTALISAAI